MDLLAGSLMLSPDVVLIPVSDLPDSLAGRLDCGKRDYAVTHLRARTPSRIVDARAAAFLKRFLKPITILQAITAHSAASRQDPERLLEEAFPMIEMLIESSVLIAVDSRRPEPIQPSFETDHRIAGFRVLRCIHLLDDVEVYQASHPRHPIAALKIARPGRQTAMSSALRREELILRHLRGRVAPRLLEAGVWRSRPYFVSQWCPGQPISAVAAEQRLKQDEAAHELLIALCIRLLKAYASLHARGVIHGDVHEGNVLVDGGRALRVIDYGFARWPKASSTLGEPARGGVGFFHDPEFAAALADRATPPATSEKAEQYSLAALVYFCLAGAHYLEFAPERQAAFRQIATAPPLPFISRGLRPSPHIESVLCRALSKSASDRFSSVAEFAGAFGEAAELDRTRQSANARPHQAGRRHRLVKEVMERFAPDAALYRSRALAAPTASVNFGAAGIAYALYRMACATRNARLLAHADLWSNRALQAIADRDAFYNESVDLSRKVLGRATPYHTASGIYGVDALIARASDDVARQQAGIEGFLRAASNKCGNLDLTLGRSGVLLIASLLAENLQDAPAVDLTALHAFGHRTMNGIWQRAGVFKSGRRSVFSYLGIAHGWAGLLYATLRWCQVSSVELPPAAVPSLRSLAALGERVGKGTRWPVSLTENASMTGWCHGSAGYVHLWTEAHRVLGGSEFLTLAEAAAWHAWMEPQQIGQICCGLAGQAYALLALSQHTGDAIWLRRGRERSRQAAAAASPVHFVNSLYRGDVGIAVLLGPYISQSG